MNLKGTKTEMNLLAGFAGESQARNKYTYYEEKAKKDGFQAIAKVFKETAHNEKAHAKIWFELLNNGMPDTLRNLQDAAAGEHYENSEMYVKFAKEAREEGFEKIAFLFEGVAKIEKEHETRYNNLINELNKNQVFVKDNQITWICGNCGHEHSGQTAPLVCPICSHPQSYFEVKK